MTVDTQNSTPPATGMGGKITLWITILSGIVTLLLTVYNAFMSNRIQQREEDLKGLQFQLQTKAQEIERQKANVTRYEWVFTHFPDVENKDPRKRNFATSLIRLALSKEEAELLFTGLQNSGDTLLQTVGQNGISNINSEPIAALVSQLDASTADSRLNAFNELKSKYVSSSAAIDLVLNLYTNDRINALSPNGVINGLYFLGGTDANAWTKQQIIQGNTLLAVVGQQKPGTKTKAAIEYFRTQMKRLMPVTPAYR